MERATCLVRALSCKNQLKLLLGYPKPHKTLKRASAAQAGPVVVETSCSRPYYGGVLFQSTLNLFSKRSKIHSHPSIPWESCMNVVLIFQFCQAYDEGNDFVFACVSRDHTMGEFYPSRCVFCPWRPYDGEMLSKSMRL